MIRLKSNQGKFSISEWAAVVVLLLAAWGLRLCLLEEVAPGWRDDELINIHAISGQPLAGEFPLYFTDASGHEPLYHYLHAGIHGVLGFNVLSGHLLSVVMGTLSVVLTYALCRRLFGTMVAQIASWALAVSFWSLMYSRTAIRHISLPPFILAIVWLIPVFGKGCLGPSLRGRIPASTGRQWAVVGLLAGASLYTYPAARVIPGLLVILGIYLAGFHRTLFLQNWRGTVIALLIVGVMWLPLSIAIRRGSSEAAAAGIGADARLAQLAVPVRGLLNGDPGPLANNIWVTLGMFHQTGDPEWLYNIPGRPVFNILGGALVWFGALLCILRWRDPRYFTLLVWFGLGLLPTFASVPPASLSHTILAQPLAVILPAVALYEAANRISHIGKPIRIWAHSLFYVLLAVFLLTNTYRDLRDYFTVWPVHGMVRFLYRADYRDAAAYLNAHSEITDVAIASNLMGPWDRLAINVDVRRDDVSVRLFNPERALIFPGSGVLAAHILIPYGMDLDHFVETVLEEQATLRESDIPFRQYVTDVASTSGRLVPLSAQFEPIHFANGLTLVDCSVQRTAEQTVRAVTLWEVSEPLDLPPIPIVANPPPPGVYSGSRLAVFAHLVSSDGELIAADDGLWVDPLTLQLGDQFYQVHHLAAPEGTSSLPSLFDIGLYDPLSGSRWPILNAAGTVGADDHLRIPVEETP